MYSPAGGYPQRGGGSMPGPHNPQQPMPGYPSEAAAAAAGFGGQAPPQQQLHPAQVAAQGLRKRHAIDGLSAEASRGLKKGKPTSRVIPPSVQRHVPESALYGQLQKDERALDWTLARKRAELTDGMASRPPKVSLNLHMIDGRGFF